MNTNVGLLPAGASRRGFLRSLGFYTTLLTVPGAFAEQLARTRKTAAVTEGPFYPPNLPLDTDNDLLIVNDSLTPAVGQVTHLSGRLLDTRGEPLRNATIEIWSTDHAGIYLADRDNKARYDSHFQGFGRFMTGSSGEYYFRTLKPVAYNGRTAAHIHYKIKMKGRPDFTTQMFIRSFPGNSEDFVYRAIGDQAAKDSVTVDFAPVPNSTVGELAARFDIVLGLTPEDEDHKHEHNPRPPQARNS